MIAEETPEDTSGVFVVKNTKEKLCKLLKNDQFLDV